MSGSYNQLFGAAGATPPVWVANSPADQGQVFISSVDKEIYRRLSASTGNSGTTDPADDAGLDWDAVSFRKTRLITSAINTGVYIGTLADFAVNANKSVIPNMTIGTRATVLSLTGRGAVPFLAIKSSTTNLVFSNSRIEIVADGRTVFNFLMGGDGIAGGLFILGSAGMSATAQGAYLAGAVAQESPDPVEFRRALTVHITPGSGTSALNGSVLAHMVRAR